MAAIIGSQHGIEAARQAFHRIDPPPDSDEAWADKVAGQPGRDYGFGPVEGTLMKLVFGHNEFEQRIASLEEAVRNRPF